MRVQKIDQSQEKRVLIGMVEEKAVLSRVVEMWGDDAFDSPWANVVGNWCIEHLLRFDRAPKNDIQGYFTIWSSKEQDDAVRRLVEDFLATLSDEAAKQKEAISPDFLVEIAQECFEKTKARRLFDKGLLLIERGQTKKAVELIEGWKRPQVGTATDIMVLSDKPAFDAVFSRIKEPPLVQYPDALGNFFGNALGRGKFISFMGREKVGKSYILQDIAFRGVEQGRNVAYFEMGDSDQVDDMKRFATRIAGRPLLKGRYEFPTSIQVEAGGSTCSVEAERDTYFDDVDPEEVDAMRRRMVRKHGADKWRLQCFNNGEAGVRDLKRKLEKWASDGWVCDLCIVDYADIMAATNGKLESRDQINETWMGLRALSQRYKCCVVTATQIKRTGYDKFRISLEEVAEDKRKFAHVNGMAAINQWGPEKKQGVYRLEWLLYRELDFADDRMCWCAGSLAHASPLMVSTF